MTDLFEMIGYHPTAAQQHFHDACRRQREEGDRREICTIVSPGRGSGKTTALFMEALLTGYENPGSKILFVTESVPTQWVKGLSQAGLHWWSRYREVTFPNQSVLAVISPTTREPRPSIPISAKYGLYVDDVERVSLGVLAELFVGYRHATLGRWASLGTMVSFGQVPAPKDLLKFVQLLDGESR